MNIPFLYIICVYLDWATYISTSNIKKEGNIIGDWQFKCLLQSQVCSVQIWILLGCNFLCLWNCIEMTVSDTLSVGKCSFNFNSEVALDYLSSTRLTRAVISYIQTKPKQQSKGWKIFLGFFVYFFPQRSVQRFSIQLWTFFSLSIPCSLSLFFG